MMRATKQIPAASTRGQVAAVGSRTVDVVWSTGSRVLRSSWVDGPFWEELSLDPKSVRLDRLNGGAPFLADHDPSKVSATLGVVERAWLESGRGLARVRFAAEGIDPNADLIFAKVRDGVITSVSIGYRIHRMEKVADGADGFPVFRAVDWEPFEVSAVSIPADPGAGFRSAGPTHPCLFITPKERTNMENQNDVTQIAVDEKTRCEAIRASVRNARLEDDLAVRLINSGTSVADARDVVINVLATRSEQAWPPRMHEQQARASTSFAVDSLAVGETHEEKQVRAATAALVHRAQPSLFATACEKGVEGFDKNELKSNPYRGRTLLELARQSLERAGLRADGLDRMKIAGRAFTMKRDSGPYAGTGDFPVLLENVMGKILMAAYGTTPDTWSKICGTTTVPDFRASPRYRTGSFSTLDALNENGEFLAKSIPDGQKTSISVVTKGNKIAISRQAIVNDDLNAFADLGAKLGRAARLSIEKDFYALLAANGGLGPTMSDGLSLFHASHANIGTSAALSVAAIDADRVVMASQTDFTGNELLDIGPSVLLVPAGLQGAAMTINRAATDPYASKINVPNIAQGLFADVVGTARLSGTRRFLFAAPSVAPAFMVAFLEGSSQAPIVETQMGWDVDGTEMRIKFDYQAQAFDYRGAVTNAGV